MGGSTSPEWVGQHGSEWWVNMVRNLHFFKKQEDDEQNIQYPGNEFMECVLGNEDTCFMSKTFLNLLENKGKGVNAYLSSLGKHSKTKCILFVIKENKEVVLYSENDSLLLFFYKK